jgi:hypothetical protein
MHVYILITKYFSYKSLETEQGNYRNFLKTVCLSSFEMTIEKGTRDLSIFFKSGEE